MCAPTNVLMKEETTSPATGEMAGDVKTRHPRVHGGRSDKSHPKLISRAYISYGKQGQLRTCVRAHEGCSRAYHILACSEEHCGVQEGANGKIIEKHEKRGDSVFCVSDTYHTHLGWFLWLKENKRHIMLRSFQLKTLGYEMNYCTTLALNHKDVEDGGKHVCGSTLDAGGKHDVDARDKKSRACAAKVVMDCPIPLNLFQGMRWGGRGLRVYNQDKNR